MQDLRFENIFYEYLMPDSWVRKSRNMAASIDKTNNSLSSVAGHVDYYMITSLSGNSILLGFVERWAFLLVLFNFQPSLRRDK